MGERAHLLSREVNLDTHVRDVIGLIDAEELEGIVLAGHSYGGLVITGVAARAKSRIRQLVYLDAALMEDGQSWLQVMPPEIAAARRKLARESSGDVSLPVPEAKVFGLSDPADLAWVQRRMTPHPFATFEQRAGWGTPIGNGLPLCYVDCADPVYAGLAEVKSRYRGDAAWNFIELKTGHDAMVSAPEETARILLRFA